MTQQFWSEFLELYKENSCLWDIHSSSYMRRDLRNAAYNILLEKYRELDPEATVDMVKKKIDIFRTGFRREQRKISEQNMLPGAEYKPSLWYYDILSFLNFEETNSSQNISMIKESNESDDQNTEAEGAIEYIDIPDSYSISNPVIKYRLKKRKVEAKRSRARTDATASSSCSFFDSNEEDDCSTYCASLRLQMRELSTEQKYIAQKLISDVIFLARTSQLTLDSSISTHTQPF